MEKVGFFNIVGVRSQYSLMLVICYPFWSTVIVSSFSRGWVPVLGLLMSVGWVASRLFVKPVYYLGLLYVGHLVHRLVTDG